MAGQELYYCAVCSREMQLQSKTPHENGSAHLKKLKSSGQAQDQPEAASSAKTNTPIDRFFQSFRGFPYNRSQSPEKNLSRLLKHFDWTDDDEKKAVRHAYKAALVKEFNSWFGGKTNKLANWHALCKALGMNKLPDTIAECKEVVKGYHVNMVDLINHRRSGGSSRVKRFSSEKESADYTVGTEKYFPRRDLEAGAVLRHLLRKILKNAKTRFHY
ncbi:erg26, C-3 sterol dehydrogenase [Ascosphaera pollenicola]|nr:erg26, C-3 sterol dehydrogenase [Ascosphaera pollenicola]